MRDLKTLNSVMLCKWNCLFAVERGALWRNVICEKYEEEAGGWQFREVRNSYGVSL